MKIKNILNSSLFKASGIYSVTSILNASIPFLLLPILTRELTPEDYGIVAMAAILINIITPFIGMSAHGAAQRKYFETDSTHYARYIGNIFILLITSSVIFLLLFFVFNSSISKLTEIPGKWLYVLLLVAISQFVSMILLTIWQCKTKPLLFGAFKIAQSLINFGLTILLVVYIKTGWEGRIVGQLVAALVGAAFCLAYMVKKKLICFEYNKGDIKDILKFSAPLIPHTLGGLVFAFTDRIFITNLVGIKETGVYTVAFQIGSVLGLITSSFNSAYIPWLFAKLKTDLYADKVKIVKFTYLYFAIILAAGLGSSFVLPWLTEKIAGESFKGAGVYVFWIVMGYVFNGMYLMVTGFVFYAKKTGMLSKVTLISAAINIPLTYILLKEFGTIGAAISTTIVFALSFIFTWILSARVYQMPWFSFNQAEPF